MSNEELMRKRVIVENKWPGCQLEVGDILIKDGNYYGVKSQTGWQQKIDKNDVEPFPYLMRPLEWYEDREVSEMPEYVKEDGQVYKVSEWHFDLASMVSVFFDSKIHGGFAKQKGECPLYGDDILPATKEEYDSFIKSKSLSK